MLFNGGKEELMKTLKLQKDFNDGDSLLWELQDFEQRAISTLLHMKNEAVANTYSKSLTRILERFIEELK